MEPLPNPAPTASTSAPKLPADYFEALGIKPKLALDVESMQRRFYELSRAFHPDRFARKPLTEQQYALDFTSLLNDAWRTLKDPTTRAEYVLSLEGLQTAEQRTKNVPAELLEEVFELNMALEEAKDGDSAAMATVKQTLVGFEAMLALTDKERDNLFLAIDAATTTERTALMNQLRNLLNRRRYLTNLVRDARAIVPET